MGEVRTRFAPSPTGYLHIGGARTALFNWLFARHHGGRFILRIEDTDPLRSRREYLEDILESLRWLGLEWDEGPYLQSQRMEIYREHAFRLLKEGKAYRCYCTPEELEEMRKRALAEGRKPKYDGRCRFRTDQPKGVPYAVRFKAPLSGVTVVDDLVKGRVAFQNEELDDLIILRSDGTPTYNFVVVVDDALMGISHVIRGDDHLNNTPRQILLYEALGYPVPKFAHLPLILGTDRTRLSKRHGATAVSSYREMGYLPQAMVNYLVRLGWSYGDQEIFSLDELVEKFSLEGVGKSPGVFNPEKLLWLNAHYIRETAPEEIARMVLPFLRERGIEAEVDERLVMAVKTLQPRSQTLVEMAEGMLFYFREPEGYERKGDERFLVPQALPFLEAFLDRLPQVPFEEGELEGLFRGMIEEFGLKASQAAQAIRVALTGKTVSPGLFEVMTVLGREECSRRLKRAIEHIKAKGNAP